MGLSDRVAAGRPFHRNPALIAGCPRRAGIACAASRGPAPMRTDWPPALARPGRRWWEKDNRSGAPRPDTKTPRPINLDEKKPLFFPHSRGFLEAFAEATRVGRPPVFNQSIWCNRFFGLVPECSLKDYSRRGPRSPFEKEKRPGRPSNAPTKATARTKEKERVPLKKAKKVPPRNDRAATEQPARCSGQWGEADPRPEQALEQPFPARPSPANRPASRPDAPRGMPTGVDSSQDGPQYLGRPVSLRPCAGTPRNIP